METRTVHANGINLHVVVDGFGPTILLLHGFPDTHHLWRHVAPPLVAGGFRVVMFDQRGYGQSDAPAEVNAYTIDKIASDAIEVLNALGISEKVKLVGHDWGSFIGWYLCLKYPERFERFVAVSVGHPLAYRNAGPEQMLKAWYIIMFQIPGLAEWLFSSNNFHALRKLSKDPEDQSARVNAFSPKGRLTAALNWYRANFGKFGTSDFGKCVVPTMGIYSTDDVALTEKQMVDSAKYMNAEWKYVRIENSTHWIPLDQPEQLSDEILKWFRKS
ncbi:MAG TPA: alpha/beta fold hydrolase [Candidatus Melainabacteria bacterium]|nr:alpha/beta fold hydrolase [Candidatus Melainabacteria bacterium]HIN63716.1 alpha/beta fold hydrolase [Candidatus Obscuribacterales bacterium]